MSYTFILTLSKWWNYPVQPLWISYARRIDKQRCCRIPEISLSLSSGILARICLEFTAITINTAIKIAAPINAPLIYMKVNAANAVFRYFPS
jgi:hypothetical protein